MFLFFVYIVFDNKKIEEKIISNVTKYTIITTFFLSYLVNVFDGIGGCLVGDKIIPSRRDLFFIIALSPQL